MLPGKGVSEKSTYLAVSFMKTLDGTLMSIELIRLWRELIFFG
jgi:hypothetical protein